MLSLQAEFKQLTDEAQLRLQAFYRRFCQGENGRLYGLGHLVYAAHASFPLVLSPELANLVWLNFKNYYFTNSSEAGQSQLVAVSDFLLSPLCRKMGHQRYDVHPEIRSFLLLLLQDGKWFAGYGIKTDGKQRLNELAHFLKQYLSTKTSDEKFDGVGFRQLNDWAVSAWLNPQLLTRELAKSFEQSASNHNENAQLWLTLQMDKVGLQYGFNVNNVQSNRELSPFYRLYYYGKARESQLYNRTSSDMYRYSGEISDFVETGMLNNEVVVTLPLLKSVAERTERKINQVQRVVSLLIGIDRRPEFPDSFVSTYGISKLRQSLINIGRNKNLDSSHVVELISGNATKINILHNIQSIVAAGNAEDICFIYYAGFGRAATTTPGGIYAYPGTNLKSNSPDDFITDQELLDTIRSGKKTPAPQVVFIRDLNESSPDLLPDKNDVWLSSSREPGEKHYDKAREEGISAFGDAFTSIINRMGTQVSYRDLAIFIRHKMLAEYVLHKNRVILKCGPENLQQRFLQQTSVATNDFTLIAYNPSLGNWQLLPTDFEYIPAKQQAHIYNYGTGELAVETPGEIATDEETGSYRFYCSAAEGLDRDKLYQVRIQKPALYRIQDYGSQPVPDAQSEKSLLDTELAALASQPNPLWTDVLNGSGSNFPQMASRFYQYEINYYWADEWSSIHIFRLVRGRFNLEITCLGNKKLSYTGDQDQIIRRLKWFMHNYSLISCQLPNIYRELEVIVDYYWQKPGGENFSQYSHDALPLMAEGMYLEDGGNIRFYPMGLQLTNNENFPVFFAAYFICDDFSIKPIPVMNNVLQPGEARQSTTDLTDLLIEMAEKKLTLQYKILFSRNPIQLNIKYIA